MARKKIEDEALVMEHQALSASYLNFDHFWSNIQKKYNLKPQMKVALQSYFETKGIKSPAEFDAGLQSFGIK